MIRLNPWRWIASLTSSKDPSTRGSQAKSIKRPLAGFEDLEDRRLLAASLVRDINGGAGDSSPAYIATLGGIAYFSANEGTNGVELWRSDNTAAGTFLLKDIYTGTTLVGSPSVAVPNSSNPTGLTASGGHVYFAANDGVNGAELWRTDGTTAGTVLVKDINVGASGSAPTNFLSIGGVLYFTADDGVNGVELWKTDGTAAGTTLVRNIRASGGSSPANLTNVGGVLYFTADDGINGVELWKSDGTSSGTNIVTNVKIGSGGSNPSSLVNVNGTLFFAADDGVNGVELWKSDGTAAGTALVANLRPGATGSSPTGLVNVNGTLFFAANDGSNGIELWKSNGTLAGTLLVRNINAAAGVGSDPANLLNLNGTLLFRANDGVSGAELWKSDGTTAGTVLVRDIRPGALGSNPSVLIDGNGQAFFAADDGTTGVELWHSDGTLAGTVIDQNIAITPVTGTPSNPLGFAKTTTALFFQANDGVAGTELFSANLPNAASVAANDSYLFDPGTPLTVAAPGLLANDTDLEGGALTAVFGSAPGLPSGGVLTVNPDGSISYNAVSTFNGRFTFTYQANDGTSSSALATVTLSSRTYQWLENLYVNMLGRTRAAVSEAEVNFWVGLIDGGTTRAAVVNAFASSGEYRANLVRGYYQRFLGRAPGAGEEAFWIGSMASGLTAEGVQVAILSSLEFYRRGSGDAAFVSNVYAAVLGRSGSTAEIGFWASQLYGGASRATVATAILNSAEGRSIQINNLYVRYLGRAVDTAARTFWLSVLASGQSITSVEAALAASGEYFAATVAV